MATRGKLHYNHLDQLKEFLIQKGFESQDLKGEYEVLRMKKEKRLVIIYKTDKSNEHLSLLDKDVSLINEFLRQYHNNLRG